MYVITVLTIKDNILQLTECYNDELIARSQFLKTISEISKSSDEYTVFEPIHRDLDSVYIYKKSIGYLISSKDLYKIVALHDLSEYKVTDA